MKILKQKWVRKKSEQINIRVTKEVKTAFSNLVKKNKTTMQVVLEEAVLNYINEKGVNNE